MKVYRIAPEHTNTYSRIALDYLNESSLLAPLVNHFPGTEGFQKAIEARKGFSQINRKVLVNALDAQYSSYSNDVTASQLAKLRLSNTYTVTTGHQQNLFTGPLYFWYKIINTIQLANALNKQYPDKHFVPIFWMATEDHDYEEVNHFYFGEKKLVVEQASGNAVGRMEAAPALNLLKELRQLMGNGLKAKELLEIFEKTYAHNTLSHATRYLVHHFFANDGLIILDADDAALKKLFRPIINKELEEGFVSAKLKSTVDFLDRNYKVQVNPREVNLFLLEDDKRERIDRHHSAFRTSETGKILSFEQLKEKDDQCFSPNVLMRPLYQEYILPNVAYIGGGAELAYWLQLKEVFHFAEIPYPIVMLRNSALWVDSKTSRLLKKTACTWEQAFLPIDILRNEKTREWSALQVDFSDQRIAIQRVFDQLLEVARQTDGSFEGAVRAEETRQLKSLDRLEKRLLKAEKRRHAEQLKQLDELGKGLYPGGVWQERRMNFSELYLGFGSGFKDYLMSELDPLKVEFVIFEHD
jgi:bacillithiol synthase